MARIYDNCSEANLENVMNQKNDEFKSETECMAEALELEWAETGKRLFRDAASKLRSLQRALDLMNEKDRDRLSKEPTN